MIKLEKPSECKFICCDVIGEALCFEWDTRRLIFSHDYVDEIKPDFRIHKLDEA